MVCVVATYLATFIYLLCKKEKLTIIVDALKDLPYSLIPFLISTAIIVATLTDIGFIQILSNAVGTQSMFVIGFFAFLMVNVVNNIPMTMLFTGILGTFNASLNTIYSVVIASNICAFLTPVGSLARIMFMSILKDNNVKFSTKKFIGYGIITSIPVMAVSMFLLLV